MNAIPGLQKFGRRRQKIDVAVYTETQFDELMYELTCENSEKRKIHILFPKCLANYINNRLEYNNRIRILQRDMEEENICATVEICIDIDKIIMKRKMLVQKFVSDLEISESISMTDEQRELMTAGIMSAIENAIDEAKHLLLPTYDELKEKGALYVNRPFDLETNRPQNIIKFLETGWPAGFIAAGLLTRPDFRRIDPQAEQALRNWVRETRSQPPPHLHIPTKSETIDRELASDPDKLRAAWRLARAYERRQGWVPGR